MIACVVITLFVGSIFYIEERRTASKGDKNVRFGMAAIFVWPILVFAVGFPFSILFLPVFYSAIYFPAIWINGFGLNHGMPYLGDLTVVGIFILLVAGGIVLGRRSIRTKGETSKDES
ncbi:hypothetical protein HYR69_06495 [Candidatus Sumerlaeota bacterium]|nr:hypothetical protein [Candidatus Sumerlaeota bacterium]MBI3736700.1 hypothetical protein [Candidatus Sumerlaeota bacterium]